MAVTKSKHGNIEIIRGPIGASFLIAGKIVATARISGRTWLLRIPGHIWPVTAGMPSARFAQIPGDKITETCTKAFPSKAAALAAVVQATEGAAHGKA